MVTFNHILSGNYEPHQVWHSYDTPVSGIRPLLVACPGPSDYLVSFSTDNHHPLLHLDLPVIRNIRVAQHDLWSCRKKTGTYMKRCAIISRRPLSCMTSQPCLGSHEESIWCLIVNVIDSNNHRADEQQLSHELWNYILYWASNLCVHVHRVEKCESNAIKSSCFNKTIIPQPGGLQEQHSILILRISKDIVSLLKIWTTLV
jgi:hypothetical protein